MGEWHEKTNFALDRDFQAEKTCERISCHSMASCYPQLLCKYTHPGI